MTSMCPECKEAAARVCEELEAHPKYSFEHDDGTKYDHYALGLSNAAEAIRALPEKESATQQADTRNAVRVVLSSPAALAGTPRFEKTYCSQCGGEFGPRDSGYSHCEDHRTQQNAAGQAHDAGVNGHTSAPVPAAPNAAPGNGGQEVITPDSHESPAAGRCPDAAPGMPELSNGFHTTDELVTHINKLHAFALSEHERAERLAGELDKSQELLRKSCEDLRTKLDNAERCVAELMTPGHVWVPVEPTQGCLMSMAIRSDHALGCPGYYDHLKAHHGVSHARMVESTISTMKKLYEEATGQGFYKPEREDEYLTMLKAGGANAAE